MSNFILHLFKPWMAVLIPLGILIGCTQPEKDVVHETVVQSSGYGGVDSGGGGNEVDGRPLESFAVDITKESAVQLLLPVLKNLAGVAPQVASDLYHILIDRQWYMVPFSLQTIPSERLGVGFQTEQVALQNLREVWIDQTKWDAMSDNDKAILLLHETFMGMFFMRYQGDYDQCISSIDVKGLMANSDDDKKAYSKARKSCDNASPFPHTGSGSGTGLPAQIDNPSTNDYEEIRSDGASVWAAQGNVDGDALIAKLKSSGLRSYPATTPTTSAILATLAK